MKNNYAWAIIILVLIIAAGAIWYTMHKTNAALDMSAASSTPITAGSTHSRPATVNGVTSGSTGTTGTASSDIRPKITSITPAHGKVGDIVMVIGVNFDPTTNNVITFGPSKGLHRADGTADNQVAALPAANGTSVTFKVPTSIESGTLCDQSNKCATYGPAGTTPGTYMVTIINRNGLSNEFPFTVTQ